jgi:hypothetical protein
MASFHVYAIEEHIKANKPIDHDVDELVGHVEMIRFSSSCLNYGSDGRLVDDE